MTKKVDKLGRIVLPVAVRRQLRIHPEDALEIDVEETGIIRLKKAGATCLRCGGGDGLTGIAAGYFLCAGCLNEVHRQM